MSDPGQRKLATIFSADVASYSAHVELNEEGALSQLAALRSHMDGLIHLHGGRVANTAGDSVIADFQSPVEAVRAAVKIQEAHRKHNETVPRNERLNFRIGINIGYVVLTEKGDLLGHGVNVASRLQSLAEPGGICLSENVEQQISGHISFPVTKIGEHYAKNMQKPIRVFSISSEPESRASYILRRLAANWRRSSIRIATLSVFGLTAATAVYVFSIDNNMIVRDGLVRKVLNTSTLEQALTFFPDHVKGEFGKSTYFILSTPALSFDDGMLVAKQFGGYLASINSREENDFLYQLSLPQIGFWQTEQTDYGPQAGGPVIGLFRSLAQTDPTKGWTWASGEPVTYTNWKIEGPENSAGNQWFVQFRNGRGAAPVNKWDDIGGSRSSFIVEIPLID